MRRFALPAVVMAGVLLLSACGKNTNDGTLPVPVGSESGTTSSTPSTAPSSEPSITTAPATTAKPTAPTAKQIIIQPGNFASNPAVQGLVTSYPLYFQALVTKDDTILKKRFPSFFYADVSQGIQDAKRYGWIMKPPGSVVVMGVQNQSDGIVRVKTCRSQTTQYWDPKSRTWTVVTPKGSPEVIEMIKTGIGWLPYRLATSKGVNCASVRYPA